MRAGVALLALLSLAAAETAAEEPGVLVRGRALSPGGGPVANARVELRPVLSRCEAGMREARGEDPAAPATRTITGPDGRFVLRAPQPGMWQVVVTADGFVPQQQLLLPLFEDVELPPVVGEVVGEAGGRFPRAKPGGWEPLERRGTAGSAAERLPVSLTGRIIDRDTRRPLPGAWVWPESDPGRWVRANAGGIFHLRGIALPAGARIVAAALGHAPSFLILQGRLPEAPPVIALAAAPALYGTVVDARGQPLGDAEIDVSRLDGTGEEEDAHTAHTAADGTFRVPGLRTGASYLVTATANGFAPASTAVAIPKPGAPLPPLRLVLEPGRMAFGQVVDGDGRPVAGARVELAPGTAGRVISSGLEASGSAPQPVRTGADGRFELPHLPTGWFRLRIEANGFPAFERDGIEIPAGTARADLGRFLLQRGAAFQGWVGDDEGNPLEGAEVWVIPTAVRDWNGFYAKGPAAFTGADGSFMVRDLPGEGSFGLDICRAGYLPLSTIVREIAPTPLRTVLRRAARISGRVIAAGGAPIPEARIESWLAGEEPGRAESLRPCRRGSGAATADADGRFRLDGLSPGWWSLRAAAEGYRAASRERLHVLAGESLEDVEIVLGPGAILTGRVFTAGGQPAPGARVSAFSEAGSVQTLAGGDGAYRLAGIEPGERTVEATLEGGAWGSRNLTVLAGDNRLDLTLDQGPARQEIHGRVLGPDGGPVAGAAVLANSAARTFSAADGAFILPVEDNQDYEVWAKKEGFAAAKTGTAVHVAGAPVAGVEIRLDRGGALTGRLLGLEPEELAQASVEVELSPPFSARAAVDPQGAYRVEEVPPGEWTITARAGDRTTREQAELAPAAAEATVDLTFEPSQEVSGQVLGPASEPVADAYVRFFAPGGTSSSTYSRSDGGFHLRLEDGTYRVIARREGYRWTLQKETVAVDGAPVSGLELRLDEVAVIRGRILGLDPGERAQAVWAATGDGGRREGQLDQEGGFVIPDVPPGDWKVTVAYGGKEASSSVHLESGSGEAWVEVEMGRP